MPPSSLDSLPPELLAKVASHAPTRRDQLTFTLLTSRLISDKLASHSGIQTLNFNGYAYEDWKPLAKRMYCLRNLYANQIPYHRGFGTQDLCQLPSSHLQVLHLNFGCVQRACIREVLEPFEPKQVVLTVESKHYEALHLDGMFPSLIDLLLKGDTWSTDMQPLVGDFILHLPRRLHNLSIGLIHLSSDAIKNLPGSLTSFEWYGLPLEKADFGAMSPETRSRLLHFHWHPSQISSGTVDNIVNSLPPNLISFHLSGDHWRNSLCEKLPRGLTVLKFTSNGDKKWKQLNNGMTDEGAALLPRSLTEMQFSSEDWQSGATSGIYNLLPRGLTKLELTPCVPVPTGACLPPCLIEFKSGFVASNPQYGPSNFQNAPPSLRSFSYGTSICPTDLPSFTLPLAHLCVSAHLFEEGTYATLPRTIVHLELQACRLPDAAVPSLPPNITTLLVSDTANALNYPLTEEAFPLFPRSLKTLSLSSMTITGALTPLEQTTFNKKVILEQCQQALPYTCRDSFLSLPGKCYPLDVGLSLTLTKLHSGITNLSIEDSPGLTHDSLKRFQKLESLTLGQGSLPLRPTSAINSSWFDFAPGLTSLTLSWAIALETLLPFIPPTIKTLRLPNSINTTAGRQKITRFIPPSITHLTISNISTKMQPVISKAEELTTFELCGIYNLTPVSMNTMPPRITTFIFGEPSPFYESNITQFKAHNKILSLLPPTITKVQLHYGSRISNLGLARLPNLTDLNVGVIQIVDLPPLPQDCSTIHVPSTIIAAFKSQYAQVKMDVPKIVVTWDRKSKIELPQSLTHLHFGNDQDIVTKDFVAKLPKGLKHLGVLYCSELENGIIDFLPPSLTTLALNGAKIYESKLEMLPRSLLHLTIRNGIHSAPELLPDTLESLRLICSSKCGRHKLLNDSFISRLPRSLKSLTIDHQMTLTDGGLKSLPPNLIAISVKAKALTLACLDQLPQSVTSIALPSSAASHDYRQLQLAIKERLAKLATQTELSSSS